MDSAPDAPANAAAVPTLAVLGPGRMGGALLRGWLAAGVVEAAGVRIWGRTRATLEAVSRETGVHAAQSTRDAVAGADVVLLAVKPPAIVPTLAAVAGALPPHALIVSVAAGVPLSALEGADGVGARPVVRVMPNTPALVGAGASAFCRGRHAGDEHAALVTRLFGAVGVVVEVTEAQIDAVIGVSGSGVAYFYLFIEALTDGGVRAGLPRDVARRLAAQTALGAARMVLETGEHPAVLKDAVTTPGGTTIAALDALERRAVRGALIEAVLAARDRAREMG